MQHPPASRLHPTFLTSGTLAALLSWTPAQAITTEELAKRLEALEAQNAALQAKVDRLEAAQAGVASAPAAAATPLPALPKAAAEVAPRPESAETTVSSYGEIAYTRPTKAQDKSNVDLARAVIAITHRFDDRTRMVGEWEWEHAVASSGDSGEAEVEQLFVEREFSDGLRGRAGLFLMPVGLINQNHEPTAYLGVFRPDVDTRIVPSTWREAGLGLSGETRWGIGWDAGVTTGPDLGKWDAGSAEGRVRGPLAAIHGEGQFAAARDPLFHAAASWRGVPGLLVGGSIVTGKIGQEQPGFLGNDSRLVFLDLHARYEILGWDFAAEYVRGTLSHTEALNTSFAQGTSGPVTLVPARFFGAYAQAAYKLRLGGDYKLIPFGRYEILNTAASYGSLAASLGGMAPPDEKIWTVGASLQIGEGIVVKADVRRYRNDKRPSEIPDGFVKGNSINLGVGYSF